MKTIKTSRTNNSKISKRNTSVFLRSAVEALESRTLLTAVMVNSASDTATGAGVITLRDAIGMANSSNAPTTITFASTVFKTAQTITLDGTALEVSGTEPVTIDGPAAGVTIDGNQLSGDLQVGPGASVSLTGMTFTGAKTATLNGPSSEACIYNNGTATLADCTVSGNSTLFSAIFNGAASTGGLGTLKLTDCTISSNSATYGGGILNEGAATLTGCTVSGNTDGHNAGGGITNEGTTLTLTDCTVSGNTAAVGGGIYSYSFGGSVALDDCTVSGNTATAAGGGLGNGAPATAFTVANSIIAGNIAKADPDAFGGFDSLGFNLVGATDGTSWGFDDFTGTTAHPLDADLGPLANNGGPTQTLLPLAGSPAIDHGNNALVPAGTTTDQRGLPRISNATVDIGAVEVQAAVTNRITLTAPAAQSAKAGQSKLFALGSFTQSKATGPFTVDVHWGDGTADSKLSVAAAGTLPAVAHTFAYSGKDTVVVSVTDSAGHTSNRATFPVSITGPSAVVVNSVSNTASGAGVVTLTDAIKVADGSAGPTTITFDPALFATPQTITLDGSDLELDNASEPTAIIGPAAGLTIDGNGESRDFLIDAAVALSLSNITVTGGHAAAVTASVGSNAIGAGIDNNGTVTLTDCTLSDNSAQNGGGGIFSGGTATLSGCSVSDNTNGGIFSAGTATLTGCTVSDNTGTGITNSGTTLTLTDCTLSGNTGDLGGGLSTRPAGTASATVTLTKCTLSGNTATNLGGGLYDGYSTVTLTDCVVSGNTASGGKYGSGGGINNFGGTLTLTNSTISGNSSTGGSGGAIYSAAGFAPKTGGTVVADCTISGNSAQIGGGVYNGGFFNPPASGFTIANTIVAGNTAPAGPDADGAFGSLGFNLVGQTNGSTGWAKTDLTGTTAKPLNADLGPLADNGGPTLTLLPLPGSPAIGHGSVTLVPKGDTTDQRGFARVVNGKVDIGAVELRTHSAVTGTVFYDANGNGIQDKGEAGLAGVLVYDDLRDLGYFVVGDPATMTGATGAYALEEVPASADVIRQIRPLGYAQTSPTDGGGHHVTVAAGQTVSGQNFGDRSAAAPPATITGTVFDDANGDGIQDDGETGLAGVQVYLDLADLGYYVTGDPTTITNAAGTYTLSGLAAGSYHVRQALPLGYIQTAPAKGYGNYVTVSAGQTLSGENFGDSFL